MDNVDKGLGKGMVKAIKLNCFTDIVTNFHLGIQLSTKKENVSNLPAILMTMLLG
jgi:hypothetical protein